MIVVAFVPAYPQGKLQGFAPLGKLEGNAVAPLLQPHDIAVAVGLPIAHLLVFPHQLAVEPQLEGVVVADDQPPLPLLREPEIRRQIEGGLAGKAEGFVQREFVLVAVISREQGNERGEATYASSSRYALVGSAMLENRASIPGSVLLSAWQEG